MNAAQQTYLSRSGTHVVVESRLADMTEQKHTPIALWVGEVPTATERTPWPRGWEPGARRG